MIPFIFEVIQVERETVMIAWRFHWGLRELGQYFVVLSSIVICMLNLSVVFICVVIMHHFVVYLWRLFIMFNDVGVIL